MKRILLMSAMGIAANTQAQLLPDSALTIGAYAEVYYGYDLSAPDNHLRPGFIYSHNRHNEVNLNLGMVKFGYAKNNLRGNLALMAGTYAQANMAAEPGMLQSVFEANAGVKLSKAHDLWLDAGVLPSHIGFESAISKDCWTLTRSLSAENTPYFETGARLGYASPNGKWYAAGLLLNGWQRIARVEGNNTPAFGTQLTWKPTARATINWSTFAGNDKPDSVAQLRIFNNLYAQVQATDRLDVLIGCDIGVEQAASGDSSAVWINPTAILRYKASERTFIAARWEMYQDEDGVIIASGTPNGFNAMGYSLNVDRWIAPNVVWRMEARLLNGQEKLFQDAEGMATTANTVFTTSLALSLP
ncbi:MAG: porin [Bacteroidetes bacterium]|nr:porin [Bacteroidota bacterium]